jgi:hypothetical protein
MINNSRTLERKKQASTRKDRIDRHTDSRIMKGLLSGRSLHHPTVILLACFDKIVFVLFYKGV